jgi:hypothetical protein
MSSSSRQEVIDLVTQAVLSDRNQDYAPPEQNFRRIADLWNTYLDGRSVVTPYDTSIMMVLVKVARIIQSPHLVDHLVDIAGYAACAADVMPEGHQAAGDPAAVAVVELGDQPGDRAASYEGNAGFLRDGVWYGHHGRKVAVIDEDAFRAAGVLV